MANTSTYTASYLLASIKRRGQIPETSDGSYGEEDLLAIASEEIQTYMSTLLMGIREEWFVRSYDQTLNGNQVVYQVPQRSIGSSLRQVLLGQDPNWLIVQRVEPKQTYGLYYGFNTPGYNGGFGPAYIFENTAIRLLSNSYSGPTLRMLYHLRPNRVVALAACGTITAINTTTKEVTVSAAPTTFTNGTAYDFIKAMPGFDTLGMDQTASITGDVLTFSSLPSTLAVGDYVALAGESPVPQIPAEMHQLLAQRVVVKVLEGCGDPKMEVAQKMCEEQRQAALTLLTPRSVGDSRYLTNLNGPGWASRYRFGR